MAQTPRPCPRVGVGWGPP